MTEADEHHFRRAIALASAARPAGHMPYGSLLIGPAGDVLAEGPQQSLWRARSSQQRPRRSAAAEPAAPASSPTADWARRWRRSPPGLPCRHRRHACASWSTTRLSSRMSRVRSVADSGARSCS
jgi:hypothetical protein